MEKAGVTVKLGGFEEGVTVESVGVTVEDVGVTTVTNIEVANTAPEDKEIINRINKK